MLIVIFVKVVEFISIVVIEIVLSIFIIFFL